MAKKISKSKKSDSYHHGDLRRACILEGLKLVAKQGAEAFSLRDIARRLGVSHGAPYRHFKNRETLLAAIASEGFVNLREKLEGLREEIHAENETDPRVIFRKMAIGYYEFARANEDHYRLMFGNAISQHNDYPELQECGEGAFAHLVGMIAEMQEQGAVRQGDPMKIAVATWSALHGFVSLAMEERFYFLELPDQDPAEVLIPRMIEQIMHGLLIADIQPDSKGQA